MRRRSWWKPATWVFLAFTTFQIAFGVLPGADTVLNIDDAFRWVEWQLTRLGTLYDGDMAQDLTHKLLGSDATMSTAFCGIGTPKQAMECVASFLGSTTHSASCLHATNVAAVEYNSESREELQASPWAAEHIYIDMLEFIHPSISKGLITCAKLSTMTPLQMFNLLVKPNALRRAAFCVQHQRYCGMPSAALHLAGTPCVDYSTMAGAKRLGTAGTVTSSKNKKHERRHNFTRHLCRLWSGQPSGGCLQSLA